MLPAIQTPEFAAMLHDQVEKRRTFAIISHPDAGKTKSTEEEHLQLSLTRMPVRQP